MAEAGWYAPFEGIWFVSDRPLEIHRKGTRLHNENDLAVRFRDGWGMYALNGVRIPPKLSWIVTTPRDQLDGRRITEIKNVEIRREFIRKAGMEKILLDTGAQPIDSARDVNGHAYHIYELPGMHSEQGRKYLSMHNGTHPDILHLEALHPDCTTVRLGMKYRDGYPVLGDRWREFPDCKIIQLT